MAKMKDDDLRDLVKRRRDAAVQHLTDDRAGDRKAALRFYRGDDLTLYGSGGDGLSTLVSRDLMESVESMLPGLVKPFIAGDETVRFEPTGPEDEEPAKQATEYVNYLFQNHNDAVRVIYDFAKDGLLYRLGVAKIVHETVSDKQLDTYRGLDEIQLAALEADKDHDIIGDVLQDEDGTYEVRCSKSVERSTFRVHIIAPDEFLFEERLASLDDGRFFGHRATKPVGDFIAMGLPKAKVKKLKGGTGDEEEADDRFENEDRRDDADDEDIARLVTIDECYVRCDYEGTGSLGWRKVFIGAAGDEIILNEEADDHPYECWTPIPIPHKLIGMSVYDLVRDLQMQGTALLRESMNALYLANRPQREVVEGQVNFEDLLNPTVGGLVRVKAAGMVREIASGGANVLQQSMAMLEQIASVREQRTGSTRYNQGLDSNSLNKTATGISIIQNASQQRQELIARHLAEGMKGIFKKLLGLVMRHLDKKQVIRLRGQWIEMDPADWKAGYDMSVAVGLGTGNRDQQVGQLTNLLDIDRQIIELQGGVDGPILTMPNVYEKLKRMVEAMGMKGIENYYTDPGAEQEQAQLEQMPDPMAEEQAQAEQAQMQAQAEEQSRAEAELQKAAAQAQIEQQKAELAAQTEMQKAELAAQTELQKAELMAQLEREKAEQAAQDAEAKVQAQQLADEQKAAFEVEKLRSAELIAQLNAEKADATVELERWKAELTARTQLEIAQISANTTLQGAQFAQQQAPQDGPRVEVNGGDEALSTAIEGMSATIQELRKPRKVIRGKDGKISGVE